MNPMPGVLRVKGRTIRAPLVSITASDADVSVRVDDGEDETVWFELTLDADRLLDFLGRIAVMHARNSTALCVMIENVAIAFKL